jgi:hypothetical protein
MKYDLKTSFHGGRQELNDRRYSSDIDRFCGSKIPRIEGKSFRTVPEKALKDGIVHAYYPILWLKKQRAQVPQGMQH